MLERKKVMTRGVHERNNLILIVPEPHKLQAVVNSTIDELITIIPQSYG